MNDDQLKQLWKDQDMTMTLQSLDDLRAGARRMQRRVALRNALEYVACVAVFACFALYIAIFPFPLMRVGSALVMIGTLVVAWQLHRRASGRPLPSDAGARSWLDYQRAQLERQRDALRSVMWWYVAPLVPGILVFRWGVETELPADAPFAFGWLPNAIVAGVMLAVIALNRYAARKLQQRIDALEQAGR